MLGELNFKRAECAVRVNSLSSNIIEEDLKVILSEGNLPQTIVLPKVEYESDLDTVKIIMIQVTPIMFKRIIKLNVFSN